MSSKLSQFWKELKRRGVLKVVTGYAATAYIIMEVGDIMLPRLGLPEWTVTFLIVLLIAGFPIALILSWIFDLTPEGFKKTEAYEVIQKTEDQSPVEGRRKLKTSDVIIILLLLAVGILLYPRIFSKDSLRKIRDEDGKISIAVMPFENLTGDAQYDGLEIGIQRLIVTRLSNADELTVRQTQSVLDISQIQQSEKLASFTPGKAAELAKRTNASTALLGSLLKSGQELRLTANLLHAGTGEIFRSFELDAVSDDALFSLTDSLTLLVSSYFQIRDMEKQVDHDTRMFSNTDIAGAYRFFAKGTEKFFNTEFQPALSYFEQALELDPDFTVARFFKYVSNWNLGNMEASRRIVDEMYARVDEDEYLDQLYVYYAKSLFDKDLSASEKYLDLILEEVPYSRGWNYETGRFYIQAGRCGDALPFLEKALEIDRSWGTVWKFTGLYSSLGNVYRETGQLDKEKQAYEMGLEIHPDRPSFLRLLAENAFLRGQDEEAARYMNRYKTVSEARGDAPFYIGMGKAKIYMHSGRLRKAENIYRDLMASGQDSPMLKADLAFLLFDQDRDLKEGMRLINQALGAEDESTYFLRIKGLGLYKMQEYSEAHAVLSRSFSLEYMYVHETFRLLEQVEEALKIQAGGG